MMQTQKSTAAFMAEIMLLLGLLVGGWYYYSTNLMHQASSTSTDARKSIVVTGGQHSVLGSPSLSADQIDSILSAHGSPAAGNGIFFYEGSLLTGIDDKWPMGFFWHESNDGTQGMARITHSIGNLRCIAGAACVNSIGYTCQVGQSCYAAFPDWKTGIKAWYALIRNLYVDTWHLTTVEQIIPTYAPPGDHNDDSAYIQNVLNTVAGYKQQAP